MSLRAVPTATTFRSNEEYTDRKSGKLKKKVDYKWWRRECRVLCVPLTSTLSYPMGLHILFPIHYYPPNTHRLRSVVSDVEPSWLEQGPIVSYQSETAGGA